jgi:hypothetical protein
MSGYYLADRRKVQRVSQDSATQAQTLQDKLGMLGELMLAQPEPRGADPYNNRPSDAVQDAWSGLRPRR